MAPVFFDLNVERGLLSTMDFNNISFETPFENETNETEVKARFRIFYWGIPGPSTGKTYKKEVAEAIVDTINTQGMMVAPSPRLNIHLVAGLVSNAELLGNVVYADITLVDNGIKAIDSKFEDGNYRCTAVLNVNETESDEISIDDVREVSHVYLYSV